MEPGVTNPSGPERFKFSRTARIRFSASTARRNGGPSASPSPRVACGSFTRTSSTFMTGAGWYADGCDERAAVGRLSRNK